MERVDVAIIGSGFGGLGMAVELDKAGIGPFIQSGASINAPADLTKATAAIAAPAHHAATVAAGASPLAPPPGRAAPVPAPDPVPDSSRGKRWTTGEGAALAGIAALLGIVAIGSSSSSGGGSSRRSRFG